jgi:hypothetical protein
MFGRNIAKTVTTFSLGVLWLNLGGKGVSKVDGTTYNAIDTFNTKISSIFYLHHCLLARVQNARTSAHVRIFTHSRPRHSSTTKLKQALTSSNNEDSGSSYLKDRTVGFVDGEYC